MHTVRIFLPVKDLQSKLLFLTSVHDKQDLAFHKLTSDGRRFSESVE